MTGDHASTRRARSVPARVMSVGALTLALGGLPMAASFPTTAATAAPAYAQVPAQPARVDGQESAYSPGDCDGNAVIGRFRRVGSGASFTFHGRVVELQNESVLDTYSRAEIKSGRRAGDKVWIDRSFKRFPIKFKGIVSDAKAKSEGWKQCGPFGKRTQSVINSVYAARACVQIPNAYRCGAWYVD